MSRPSRARVHRLRALLSTLRQIACLFVASLCSGQASAGGARLLTIGERVEPWGTELGSLAIEAGECGILSAGYPIDGIILGRVAEAGSEWRLVTGSQAYASIEMVATPTGPLMIAWPLPTSGSVPAHVTLVCREKRSPRVRLEPVTDPAILALAPNSSNYSSLRCPAVGRALFGEHCSVLLDASALGPVDDSPLAVSADGSQFVRFAVWDASYSTGIGASSVGDPLPVLVSGCEGTRVIPVLGEIDEALVLGSGLQQIRATTGGGLQCSPPINVDHLRVEWEKYYRATLGPGCRSSAAIPGPDNLWTAATVAVRAESRLWLVAPQEDLLTIGCVVDDGTPSGPTMDLNVKGRPILRAEGEELLIYDEDGVDRLTCLSPIVVRPVARGAAAP